MVSNVPMTVFYSTSFDVDHPPSNVVDNDETTFWMTTGLFPQEIVLHFKKPAQITRITTIMGNVRNLIVYAGLDKELSDWQEIDQTSLPRNPIKQVETHQLNFQRTVYAIKLLITKGWDQFTALYQVRVEGPTVREEETQNTE